MGKRTQTTRLQKWSSCSTFGVQKSGFNKNIVLWKLNTMITSITGVGEDETVSEAYQAINRSRSFPSEAHLLCFTVAGSSAL